MTTLGSGQAGGWAGLLGANVILGNIHQFYPSNASGQSNLSSLMNGPDFVVFNDEAHNAPAPEWDATLDRMRPKTLLRLDTTATPDRADGQSPDSKMVYEYLIQDALSDRLVKQPVIYQPNIATVQLTYRDARTGETRSVEEIDWADVDLRGLNATQWVTDDKPMQQQMAIALRRLAEQEKRAKERYQPVLFVVAVCKLDAEKAARTLNQYFKVKTLLVTEDSSDEDRQRARELGRMRRGRTPYKAVVSVLMLREGWDVPEVGVILLLRKFGSKVYGQQVIGRGLRRVRLSGITEEEQQICAVVDHPKLEHGWLWEIFGSKIRSDVGIDDEFDETEDLPEPPPRQELVKPENVIDVPPPTDDDGGDFCIDIPSEPAEPLKNWKEVLEGLAYPTETVTITGQDITSVEGRELTAEGWRIVESAPEDSPAHTIEPDGGAIADGIQGELLNMAERLLERAGHSSQFKGRVYSILLQHIHVKFLDGASLRLADGPLLDGAWRMLSKVEERVGGTPGLVEGMVKYGDQ
ncbi:MAG: DEAD/DEAH box helicase family protein [Chloroflexota bacterium]|nr:DEAD/DEAH box helicase family protein [Chloroflexota bacterium]